MKEKPTVNRITSWDNVVNLENARENKLVRCQLCGLLINEDVAIFKEDEGYYCPSCDKRIYRNSEVEELKEQIKNLEEIISTLRQKLNAYEGESDTSYEEIYGDITD